MVNPDGIDLVTGNVPENSEIFSNYMQIARNFPNIPFQVDGKQTLMVWI